MYHQFIPDLFLLIPTYSIQINLLPHVLSASPTAGTTSELWDSGFLRVKLPMRRIAIIQKSLTNQCCLWTKRGWQPTLTVKAATILLNSSPAFATHTPAPQLLSHCGRLEMGLFRTPWRFSRDSIHGCWHVGDQPCYTPKGSAYRSYRIASSHKKWSTTSCSVSLSSLW